MTKTNGTRQATCPTCGYELDGTRCIHCDPAGFYDDLADWHERQAQWARGAAKEVRERQPVNSGKDK